MPTAHIQPIQPVFWNQNKPAHTYLLDGISLLLPHGETFMVKTLAELNNQGLIPHTLKIKVEQFVDEENRHSQAHVRYNTLLKAKGYDIEALDEYIRTDMQKISALSLREKLIICCALEILTSFISKKLLRSKHLLTQAESYETRLWTWHCKEEIAHAGTMIELYEHIIGSKWPLFLAVPTCACWLLADLRKSVSCMVATDQQKHALSAKDLFISLGQFSKDFLLA